MTDYSDKGLSKEKEQQIINALRTNPNIADCVLELIDISESDTSNIRTGDEAEEATISAIQKTGHAILQAWFERQSSKATNKLKSNANCRPHEKKK